MAVLTAGHLAWAWGTAEHQQLGSTSYLRACAEVVTVAAAPGASAGVQERLEIACGANVAVFARIYGDGTAVAGDYVGHPSELTSSEGAWRFSSPKHYWLLALENSAHFDPMATYTWREHHMLALEAAMAAASTDGLPMIDSWAQAVRENAFADHFLQDSFAAGHMGFNRRASSAGAAWRFHDTWNTRGRVVNDLAGNRWTTYGDGRLNEKATEDGRRHVVDAATGSVRDLLLTFVLGRRDPQESLAVLQSLPFTIEAPEVLADAEQVFVGRRTTSDATQTPLVSTVRPARKDTVVHAGVWSLGPFSEKEYTMAATADIELAIPHLPAQASLGGGGTLHEPDGKHRAVLDAGLLFPLGLSVDGFISHELELSTSTFFRGGAATVVHVDYEANVELATWMFTAHVGLAEFVPALRAGWSAGLGVGFLFSAAGGGAF